MDFLTLYMGAKDLHRVLAQIQETTPSAPGANTSMAQDDSPVS